MKLNELNNIASVVEELAKTLLDIEFEGNPLLKQIFVEVDPDKNTGKIRVFEASGNVWPTDDNLAYLTAVNGKYNDRVERFAEEMNDVAEEMAIACDLSREELLEKAAWNAALDPDEVTRWDILAYIEDHEDLTEKVETLYYEWLKTALDWEALAQTYIDMYDREHVEEE